ncbi:MAG TPA: hypothetical protein VFV89_14050 [Nocardioides sp.]|uniref:hypothetical protein n=1 Tax=Nocardioides sp. TaxID=35761 RepID=UPI002E331CAC|nr:hypothetical protein [Nocardioides sp.]HEX5088928.1 hypothetical protein [Nocardioides sp.]
MAAFVDLTELYEASYGRLVVHSPKAWIRTVALNRVRAGWRHTSVVRRLQPKVPGPQVPVEAGPH